MPESPFAISTPFTAHNVRLDDGTLTKPDTGWTIDQHPVFLVVQRLLRLLFPLGVAGRSIVDLGCLEGGFALEFARLGMISTGIEVRDSNMQNCRYVQERCKVASLRFVKDDVMNIADHGPFDVIFANGLLYHLDHPLRFLRSAASVCRSAIILHTHVAHLHDTPSRAYHELSDVELNEGVRGRWYRERDAGEVSEAELERLKWHSWSNHRSFWVAKGDLLQILREIGFDMVFETFDWLGNIATELAEGHYATSDRVMIVGIRSPAAGA